MVRTLRTMSLVVLLGAGAALAADKGGGKMAHAKDMAMKERAEMVEKAKAIDAKVSAAMASAKGVEGEKGKALEAELSSLQSQVKALMAQLEKAPKYFDEPTQSALKP